MRTERTAKRELNDRWFLSRRDRVRKTNIFSKESPIDVNAWLEVQSEIFRKRKAGGLFKPMPALISERRLEALGPKELLAHSHDKLCLKTRVGEDGVLGVEIPDRTDGSYRYEVGDTVKLAPCTLR